MQQHDYLKKFMCQLLRMRNKDFITQSFALNLSQVYLNDFSNKYV